MAVKQLNIKYRTYSFYNDLINDLNFEPNNLKLHKKNMDFIILAILIKTNLKIGV